MKNIKHIVLGAALTTVIFFAVSFDYSAKSTVAEKKFMVVEVIFGFEGSRDVSGIYVTYGDGREEFIELIGYVGQDNIKKNAQSITKHTAKVYSEGWVLESAVGGDNSKRYVYSKSN